MWNYEIESIITGQYYLWAAVHMEDDFLSEYGVAYTYRLAECAAFDLIMEKCVEASHV